MGRRQSKRPFSSGIARNRAAKNGRTCPMYFLHYIFTIYVTREPQRPLMGIYKWSQRSLDFPIEIIVLCNCTVLKESFFGVPVCKKLLEGSVVYNDGNMTVF